MAAVQTYLDGAVAPMADVLAGDFDLRVPVIMAVIDSLTKLSQSDVVVDLVASNFLYRSDLRVSALGIRD